MAQLRISKTAILRPVKKAGHHALNKSTELGMFVHDHPLGSALGFFIGIISLGFGIWGVWLALFTDIKPQVSAVVSPATAALKADADNNTIALKADGDNNTKKILEFLKAQLATQVATATILSPQTRKSPPPPIQTQTMTPIAQPMVSPTHPLAAAPTYLPPPAALTPIRPATVIVPTIRPKPQPPAPSELTKDTPIIISDESGDQYLAEFAVTDLSNLLTSEGFNIVTSQTSQAHAPIQIEILSAVANALPSGICSPNKSAWSSTVDIQISVSGILDQSLFPQAGFSGSYTSCLDDVNAEENDANYNATKNAVASLDSTISKIVGENSGNAAH
jgi:hypothetical protein